MGKGSKEDRKPKKAVEKTNASAPSMKEAAGSAAKGAAAAKKK